MDLRRMMEEQRAATQIRIAHARDRASSTVFGAALLSARSIADQTVSHREKLDGQKDQLRKCEAHLAEALSTIEALEANSDAKGQEDLEEAVTWYNKFLGFQVVGGEGVKFVFNKIDMQYPDKEYSFCIKLNKDRYNLLKCIPFVEGSNELMKDLNCNNDLFKFVRIMRERFLAATNTGALLSNSFCLGMPSIRSLLVDSRNENSTNHSQTQGGSENKEISTKKGQTSGSGASPGTVLSSMRRSPRILERR